MLRFLLILLLVPLSVCWAEPVTDQRLQQAVDDPANWLSHGKDYREQRFSPLNKINADNVAALGLGWYVETDDVTGLQATPLVADGVMYVPAAWNVIYAINAATGEVLWKYDPKVPRDRASRFCCGAVSRGVALWEDKVFAATLDGRLLALEAATGKLVWSVQTTPLDQNYSITGAPRVVHGKVIIGNGGSEFGVRGYITAYDAATGEQAWRFYTVPGNPADGFENAQMALAARTWKGEWWKMGGGGTVWDSMSYDPQLNLLYIGVGNGGPHNQNIRSPGGGDNLFLASIVALNPDTGEYVWHYQQVPGESWDYTASQQMSLMDIEWQGEQRKVIAQASKAGFFYLIDRITGELLSAEKFVYVTWASHYDMQTGRPVENPGKRYLGEPATVFPTGMGGHNWRSMSYSPVTGLYYIPALDMGSEFIEIKPEDFKLLKRHWNLGYKVEGAAMSEPMQQAMMKTLPQAFLMAWDPIAQREVWRVPHPFAHGGGALATGGNLVFQGRADGQFIAYRADTGESVWAFDGKNGIMAAPISYEVNGEQYIAIAVGRGGGLSQVMGVEYEGVTPRGRFMAFKLGGTARLPALNRQTFPEPPPRMVVSPEEIEAGRVLFSNFCFRCHGVNAISDGSVPDLRHLTQAWYDNFDKVILAGSMEQAGMPRFDDVLDERSAHALKAYIIERANEDKEERERPGWWQDIVTKAYGYLAVLVRWNMHRE